MKNKNILLPSFICLAVLSGKTLSAQINPDISGKPKDFLMLKERPLIVEMMEEDPKVIKRLSKDTKNLDSKQRYIDFIRNNNIMLKNAVDKYWKLNSTIQYKTTSELKDIVGSSKDYVIISFHILENVGMNTCPYSVPVIYYNRSERKTNTMLAKVPDYDIYLPPSFIPDNEMNVSCWTYMQCDYDFSIRQMQDNINYMISNNTKLIFENYAKKMNEENCGKLQKNTLVIDSNQGGGSAKEKYMKLAYHYPFILTDKETCDNAFLKQEKGKEIIFSYPYGIYTTGNSGGYCYLYYAKIVIDCATGEILFYRKPGNGETNTDFEMKDFYDMDKCK